MSHCPSIGVLCHYQGGRGERSEGEGGGGRGMSCYTMLVYWLEGFFEICNHILENAFSLYTISKIMLKLLINYL